MSLSKKSLTAYSLKSFSGARQRKILSHLPAKAFSLSCMFFPALSFRISIIVYVRLGSHLLETSTLLQKSFCWMMFEQPSMFIRSTSIFGMMYSDTEPCIYSSASITETKEIYSKDPLHFWLQVPGSLGNWCICAALSSDAQLCPRDLYHIYGLRWLLRRFG